MGKPDRARRANKFDQCHKAKKAKDKKQVATPKGPTRECFDEKPLVNKYRKYSMLNCQVVCIGHLEINKAGYVRSLDKTIFMRDEAPHSRTPI